MENIKIRIQALRDVLGGLNYVKITRKSRIENRDETNRSNAYLWNGRWRQVGEWTVEEAK